MLRLPLYRATSSSSSSARNRRTAVVASSAFLHNTRIQTRQEGHHTISWAQQQQQQQQRCLHSTSPISSLNPFCHTINPRQRTIPTSRLQSTTSEAEASDDIITTTSSSSSEFYSPTHTTFTTLSLHPILLNRLKSLNFNRPSAVQASAFDAITSGKDVTIGAETGSGKTLAYLLPLIDDILRRKDQRREKRQDSSSSEKEDEEGYYDYARAIILVPNKELVNQVVRMACDLCGGKERCFVWGNGGGGDIDTTTNDDEHEDDDDVVRIAIMPGGLSTPRDYRPFRSSHGLGGTDPPIDLLITTPASLGPFGLSPKNIDLFADIQTLIIDEADMLLDGGYIRPLENVLMGFRRADKLDVSYGITKTQYVFVAATIPDMGLKSVDSYITKKFPYVERIAMKGMHNARHYGLKERTVWLKDVSDNGNRERMERLVELLKDENELLGEKVMVFLNSVEDVDGATNALRRAGINAVPYHGKIPLSERTKNLERYRRYSASSSSDTDNKKESENNDNDNDDDTVPVLVCTDLASRGLDIPGVTAIVQLQFALNVVSHLHRMGRCGRAGNRDGRGVIFYNDDREGELVKVVREAEVRQERMVLEGDVLDDEEEKEVVDGQKGGSGSVREAFSRRRGFTKKRKKEIRRKRMGGDTSSDDASEA